METVGRVFYLNSSRDVRIDIPCQQQGHQSSRMRERSTTRRRMGALTCPDGCIFNGTKIAAKTRRSASLPRRRAHGVHRRQNSDSCDKNEHDVNGHDDTVSEPNFMSPSFHCVSFESSRRSLGVHLQSGVRVHKV